MDTLIRPNQLSQLSYHHFIHKARLSNNYTKMSFRVDGYSKMTEKKNPILWGSFTKNPKTEHLWISFLFPALNICHCLNGIAPVPHFHRCSLPVAVAFPLFPPLLLHRWKETESGKGSDGSYEVLVTCAVGRASEMDINIDGGATRVEWRCWGQALLGYVQWSTGATQATYSQKEEKGNIVERNKKLKKKKHTHTQTQCTINSGHPKCIASL